MPTWISEWLEDVTLEVWGSRWRYVSLHQEDDPPADDCQELVFCNG